MKELMKKRQQTFRTQCVKYSRYVLNDHFVLFMLIFIGFLAVQYSQFLQDLPKDTSLIRWSLMIGLLLLVPIGSIATYLEKPDALFLLVKEEEVKRYIKGQAKKSFVFWFLIQSFVLLLFVPLLLATGLDKLAIVAYILVLGVAKGAVFSWKEARFYQDGNLNWTLAIARENARKQLILRFFALFTTVKGITNSVKRRAYLDGLTRLLPKTHAKTWQNMFLRSYLRNGDLFPLTLRLLLLALLTIVFVSQSWIAAGFVVLFNYLLLFQLLALYEAFDYQYLTQLFPLDSKSKIKGARQVITGVGHGVLLFETLVAVLFFQDKMAVLAMLGVTIFLYLVYLPYKLKRLVD